MRCSTTIHPHPSTAKFYAGAWGMSIGPELFELSKTGLHDRRPESPVWSESDQMGQVIEVPPMAISGGSAHRDLWPLDLQLQKLGR